MNNYQPKNICLKSGRKIGLKYPPYFIAEIGINHNGDFNRAIDLIRIAKMKGADSVKFQKRDYEKTIAPKLLDADYNHSNSFGATYREHKEFLEFTDEQLIDLSNISKKHKIAFSCSAFDIESYDFIEEIINPEYHKIPSPLVVNHDLLIHVAKYNKPIFISTGMSSQEEIDDMLALIIPVNSHIVLMQCTSLYPTENYETNLNVIKMFQEKYNLITGFSSHDRSVVFPSVAVGLGARVIEKHITQDRTMRGPDHASSFEPRGLELACKYARETFEGLGNVNKIILEREYPVRQKHFQSIVASQNIKKGDKLLRNMLTYKSPGNGIMPNKIDTVLNKVTRVDYKKDELIKFEDLI